MVCALLSAFPCQIFISTSFLTTSRRLLQFSSPTGSAAAETSEGPSNPPSPRGMSSQSSSNLPSPVGASSKSGIQTWSLDTDLSSSRAATLTVPSPSALQDNSSQDTQSSGTYMHTLWRHCEMSYHKWIEYLSIPLSVCRVVIVFSFLLAYDGDSVIIVSEHKGKKQDGSRLVVSLIYNLNRIYMTAVTAVMSVWEVLGTMINSDKKVKKKCLCVQTR